MSLSKIIIQWYQQNKRDLPWRETKDPYKIWVSEIILQQTRVNQGIGYYYKFIETYPTINSLAKAHIDDVLKLWQGLGYYSRAKNMHETAQIITKVYNGNFPTTYNEIIKLKGIGEYTAAAISSFCFNYAVPAIDGNVIRVLSRFFGIQESFTEANGKKIIKEIAEKNIDKENPAIYNQAMMEFGATQCFPKAPLCDNCPLRSNCYARNYSLVDKLPVKKKKIKITTRYFYYLHILHNGNIFIEQRKNNDIWQLLYQLPLIESNKKLTTQEILKHDLWKKIFKKSTIEILEESSVINHQLSHQQLIAKFFKVKINRPNNYLKDNYLNISGSDIDKYGIPRLIDKYFDQSS